MNESHVAKTNLPGFYTGVVEFINDPTQMGRIKVRIPVLYGLAEDVPVENLPWARPCLPFGSGSDFGTYMIPPVGTTVWIAFEGGNVGLPIWVGTWSGTPSQPRPMLRDSNLKQPPRSISMSPDAETPWMAPPGPEGPSEGLRQVDRRPEVYVPLKTPKGAAIVVEDRDEAEELQILDRAGQGLTLSASVRANSTDAAVETNLGNKAARKTRTAERGKPIDPDSLLFGAGINLLDHGGQGLRTVSDPDSCSVTLSSRQTSELENKELNGDSSVSIELNGSQRNLRINITRDNAIVASIRLDGKSESVTINARNGVYLNTDNLVVSGDLSIRGNLVVHKDCAVLGETSSVTNDGRRSTLTANPLPQV